MVSMQLHVFHLWLIFIIVSRATLVLIVVHFSRVLHGKLNSCRHTQFLYDGLKQTTVKNCAVVKWLPSVCLNCCPIVGWSS